MTIEIDAVTSCANVSAVPQSVGEEVSIMALIFVNWSHRAFLQL